MTPAPNSSAASPGDTDVAPSSPNKPSLDLSVTKVIGGALAAVTTALAASFFGVTGTLSGAAFGSVVSSVAAAIYATSLQTAGKKIKTTRSVVPRSSTLGSRAATPDLDPRDPAAVPPE